MPGTWGAAWSEVTDCSRVEYGERWGTYKDAGCSVIGHLVSLIWKDPGLPRSQTGWDKTWPRSLLLRRMPGHCWGLPCVCSDGAAICAWLCLHPHGHGGLV